MQELCQFLASKKFHIEPEFTGKLLRFNRAGTNTGWFVGRQWPIGDKVFMFAQFGDWKTNETFEWKSSEDYTPEEVKEGNRLIREAQKEYEEQKEKEYEDVAKRASDIWSKGSERGSTPYLERKGLNKLFGARISNDRPNNLIVPLHDVEGRLWNIQRILPEKYGDANIDKIFEAGGKIKGLFHKIGEIFDEGRIFICEGFATGASIHEATGHAVVCSFNAGNLFHVAKRIREKYPKASITIAGDNDLWTKQNGVLHNVGKEKATYAAMAVSGNKVFPTFKNLQTRPTDFNDLMLLEGIASVKEQILNPPSVKEIESILEVGKDGKIKKASEFKIVSYLLEYFDDKIVSQDGELFKFVNTHWQHQGEEEVRQIKLALALIAGNGLKNNEIDSAFRHFMKRVRVSPKNLFQSNPFYANFLNGTLRISKVPGERAYSREFGPHSAGDYITNVIPMNYEPEKREVNIEFCEAVERIFSGDPDKFEKVKALKEMFGACLTPLFPRIFMLVGHPGSGKSTFCILASKLVSQDNLSMVEPHEFRGFHMESMLGKLVNISTDIKTNEPIDDAMMKKIEDRIPVRIDRKFAKAVMAWLPAVHIFGCNELPPNFAGHHGAFTRRTSIIKMQAFTASGNYNKNFANDVFDLNPQGILNFALEGLESLLESGGHFSNAISGKTALEAWQATHDPIGQFLSDLKAFDEAQKEVNGSQIVFSPKAKTKRVDIWTFYSRWHESTHGKKPRQNRTQFFDQIGLKLGAPKKIQGHFYYVGIEITESIASQF